MLRDFIAGVRNVVIAGAIAIAPLSACGVKGPLKLPPAPAAGSKAPESPAAPAQETPADAVPQPPAARP
jgi:predicted small lipoprotein YifL